MNVLDLFSGPGGWDVAARELGLDPLGIEWDDGACATRQAAGLRTLQADVSKLDPADFGPVDLLIASPPCQDFSMAGKRAGIEGGRGKLVREVLRWVNVLRPTWIACEQVPPVLEIWQHFAHIFRSDWGYSAWTGVLNAADYGVPQTRQRAILIARCDGLPALPPEPTHCRGGAPESMFGPGLEPWVSMADALGWDECATVTKPYGEGMTERWGEREPTPASRTAPTVISKARSWTLHTNRGQDEQGNRGQDEQGNRQTISSDRPAPAFSTKSGGQWVREHPAPTVGAGGTATGGAEPFANAKLREQIGFRITVEEAAALQSFPAAYPWQGSRTKQFEQIGNAVPPRLARHVLAAVLNPGKEAAA